MGSIKTFAMMNGTVHFHVSEMMYGPLPPPPHLPQTVNVTVIAFALIMRQRKPCRPSCFVNGPTDGSLHFASQQKSRGFQRDRPPRNPRPLYFLNLKFCGGEGGGAVTINSCCAVSEFADVV